MFSQNKNYLSKFLQLTGILSVFILIFFSHNKVFGNGKNIKEQIVEIKNQDQQKADIKTKADALLQEISTFETDIKKIFTTTNIQDLQKIFEDEVFDSLSTEITNKLTTTQNIPQADKNILENMQKWVQAIKDQKPNYLSDASVLSKAGEKTLEEVTTAFIKIMDQTQLLKTHMENLKTKKTELTDANKLSNTHIDNLINKINSFLNKSQSSKLEEKNTQLTKIETDYQKLKKSETAATTTKSISAFQIIIIGVFITIMISVIIVWILQQIKKNQSKR
ncbi:MAG: hypothetical protein WJU30_00247 [Candidatus Phytoplasma pruni]